MFSIPCRAAIYADDYRQACEVNQQVQGKKFSIQTWNICRKIQELDRFLVRHPEARDHFYESHPELAFARLAGGVALPSKKSLEGFNLRLALLRQHLPDVEALVQRTLTATKRAQVAKDDVLDALVLSITGALANEALIDSAGRDERGIPIRMVIPVAVLP